MVTPHLQARLVVVAVTRADDGMDLFRAQTFEAETVGGLPAAGGAGSGDARTGQEPGSAAQGAGDGAVRWAGDSCRARGGGVLSRGAGASARRPAPARRRRGPDIYQGHWTRRCCRRFFPWPTTRRVTKFGNTWLSGSYEYDDEGQKARARGPDRGRRAEDVSHVAPADCELLPSRTATAARRPAACPRAARAT